MNEYKDYLVHYGIKGQKWGVRRYQNLDGSLTPAGRERYGSDSNKRNKKKSLKSMTDQELDEANRRLQKEQQYRQLSKNDDSQVKKILLGAGTALISSIIIGGATRLGQEIINKLFKDAKREMSKDEIRAIKEEVATMDTKDIQEANKRFAAIEKYVEYRRGR